MSDGPVYVASSWRNRHQPGVVATLRGFGVPCYDFRNPVEGDHGFAWQQCAPPGMNGTETYVHGDEWPPERIIETLRHPVATRAYALDFGAMRKARSCVMVMPCGKSAHLEAGYFVGAGRPLHIYFPEPSEPELMWRMAYETGGSLHTNLASVIEALRG